MIYQEILCYSLFLLLPTTMGAIPGTFFWRPRLGIDLAIPTTEPSITAYQPNKENIRQGIVVLIEGYDILTSMLGLLSGMQYAVDDDTLNPMKGIYYTGCYRWSLRALSLFPHWLRGNFHEALSVWHSRFKFMNAEVPNWMKRALPWVTEKSWKDEKKHLERFKKHSEAAFSSFYRFPSKSFNNFDSFLPDTIEDFMFSSQDRDMFKTFFNETSAEKSKRLDALSTKLQANKVQGVPTG